VGNRKQGQGDRLRGVVPLPALELNVLRIDSLEEITGWLGTFRERLRAARRWHERPAMADLTVMVMKQPDLVDEPAGQLHAIESDLEALEARLHMQRLVLDEVQRRIKRTMAETEAGRPIR